jgi:hypothetical protein
MDDDLGHFEPEDLKFAWKDEAKDFTPWLAKEHNLGLLGENIGIDLELVEVEKCVGVRLI